MKSVNTEDDECKLLSTESVTLSSKSTQNSHPATHPEQRISHWERGEKTEDCLDYEDLIGVVLFQLNPSYTLSV